MMALGYYKNGEWVPLLANRYDGPAAIGLLSDNSFRLTRSGTPTFSSIGPAPISGIVNVAGGVRAFYSPFIVPRAITVTGARLHTTTSVAGLTGDAYLHSADTNWGIVAGSTTTLATGIDFSTTGAKTITSLSLTLQPGRYLSEIYKSGFNNLNFRAYMTVIGGAEFMEVDANQNTGIRLFSNSTTANSGWQDWQATGSGGFAQLFSWEWDWA